jgi:hypothetical protein
MKIISVQEIATHLKNDAPDKELMQTYGLSSEELKALYDQLIRAVADGSLYVDTGRGTSALSREKLGGKMESLSF